MRTTCGFVVVQGLFAGVLLQLVACAREATPVRLSELGAEAEAIAEPGPIFVDMAEATGLRFVHDNGMTGKLYFVEMMGAGGALFDYDGDGDLDAYLAQGYRLEPGFTPPPDAALGRLFRNDLEPGPEGGMVPHFSDVTETSGLRASGYGMGVAVGDYDRDGHPDLYLANWGANQLWRNTGDGRFEDRTEASGTDDPR
jgi:hypothetical protein